VKNKGIFYCGNLNLKCFIVAFVGKKQDKHVVYKYCIGDETVWTYRIESKKSFDEKIEAKIYEMQEKSPKAPDYEIPNCKLCKKPGEVRVTFKENGKIRTITYKEEVTE